jgi:hypothetical protein
MTDGATEIMKRLQDGLLFLTQHTRTRRLVCTIYLIGTHSLEVFLAGIVINLAAMSANHFVSIVSLSCLYLLRESGKLTQLTTSLVIL